MERLALAQLPTPLEAAPRLSERWGGPTIWIKRDDLTGFGLSGNKVRKLEYHVAAANAAGATTFVTCGAVQSNHCRATALVAVRVGMKCVLVIRSHDGSPPDVAVGNHFLQRLAGAEIRMIDRKQWFDRAEIMNDIAAELAGNGQKAWVMPAGASDEWGVAAFEAAMHELADQVEAESAIPSNARITVWHASSSGGTTAGLAAGAAASPERWNVFGSSVGETEDELRAKVRSLLDAHGAPDAPFEVTDAHVGLGYGKTTPEELAIQVEATRATGLIWDPTYTGKALVALRREIDAGRFAADDHVVFWHTGGGFAAFSHDFADLI